MVDREFEEAVGIVGAGFQGARIEVQDTPEEERAIERSLAFEFAQSVIGAHFVDEEDSDGRMWLALQIEVGGADPWHESEVMDEIASCVKYLEGRGLIERHPLRSGWLLVKDECEEVRHGG